MKNFGRWAAIPLNPTSGRPANACVIAANVCMLGASGSIARSPGPISQSMPVYTFNATARSRGPYDFASNIGYNMQLTMRYSF